jgi:DNA-binding MarR family transcriptional regulator
MKDEPSALQREIRQTRPFASRQQEAAVAILRTADVVRRRLSGLIEPSGVTLQQYNVLRILRGAHPDALPTLEIGERLIERMPGITGLLDRLEGKGYVTRERAGDDRRQVLCRITESGRELLAGMDGPVLALDEAIVADLSAEEVDTLIEVLARVRRSGE